VRGRPLNRSIESRLPGVERATISEDDRFDLKADVENLSEAVVSWWVKKAPLSLKWCYYYPPMKSRDPNHALKVFRERKSPLRTRDLIDQGVHTDALYGLRETGQVIEIGRGLYRLVDAEEAEYPDLAEVAARAQAAAVCLISALDFHGITTQIPSSIHLAVPRGNYHRIKLSVPVTVYRFDPKTFSEGLETHRIAEMPIRIYNIARTLADCFKFRNKIGLDVALEALRLARQRKRVQNRDLLRYAKLLRVEKVISPYLEAVE